MADEFLRRVADDVARMVARLAPVADSAGNVAVGKAELAAELAAYFHDSISVESFMDLAYPPISTDGTGPGSPQDSSPAERPQPAAVADVVSPES